MRVNLLTREYPPDTYGGAGVHVGQLAEQLRSRVDLEVHCWGVSRPHEGVFAHPSWAAMQELVPESIALQAMSIDLSMTRAAERAEIVHSHTWYTNLAGRLAQLAWQIPHVVTAHSLEPRRPWKVEQLGGGYQLSSFCEKTGLEAADAIIAVSEGMRQDILGCYPAVVPERVHVIHNGVDPNVYRPTPPDSTLQRYRVELDRPYIIFLGRVSRQKGISHLLKAVRQLDPAYQVVVLAGRSESPEVAAEVDQLFAEVAALRGRLIRLDGNLPRAELIQLLSAATALVCPSIYEPFGLVNLEAMACGTAVVASAVGGIPEVVVEGESGFLVEYDDCHPEAFERGLVERMEQLLADPRLAERMGRAGRRRVVDHFSWSAIADQTIALYSRLLGRTVVHQERPAQRLIYADEPAIRPVGAIWQRGATAQPIPS
ncbi:MAG: glycogen synthase [Candidatus Dormibacteraceae bacterium]